MHVRVLGPLEIHLDDVVRIRRHKPATVLALLATHAGSTVSVDILMDGLWGEAPPDTAAKTLQTYISQLRALLGDERDRIVTDPGGYRLDVDPEAVDANRFEALVALGRRHLGTGQTAAAREAFDEAMALWGGSPYSDFAYETFARPEIDRLEELRLGALEGRAEAALAEGAAAELVPELSELVRRYPLREQFWSQLMRALIRSGSRAEALGVYRRAEETLAAELGVEPGPQLRRLRREIVSGGVATEAAPVPDVDGPRPLEVERRWATLVSLLISGSPSGWQQAVSAVAGRFGGTVLEATEEEASLVFGVPAAHDDDTDRAVRACLELARRLGSAAEGLRAGVALGVMQVARDGDTVAGRAVAAARTLAEAAPGGGVLLDPEARRAARQVRVAIDETGARVVAVREEGPVGSMVPMVGRVEERALLRGLWRLVNTSRRPHLVTLVGDPGIGKSRLVRELIDELSEDAWVVEGRSFPYGDAVFGAVGEVVRRILDLDDTQPTRQVRTRIEESLTAFLPPDEQDRVGEYLVTLLSVLGDIAEIRQTTIDSLRRLLEVSAARRPMLMVFEGLHWAHPDLLTLVERTVAHARDVPLMVIGVARPQLLEVRPEWGTGLGSHTVLTLDPLGETEVSELVERLAGSSPSPELLREVAAAGGNPLFVEELVAWSAGGKRSRNEIPTSVRSVIAARLDALDPGVRRLAVDAAVVGSRFSLEAVAALTGVEIETARGVVDRLEQAGLVVRSNGGVVPADQEWRFRHDLIAEVAYSILTEEERRSRHLQLARWLETRPQVSPAVLGHHWREAGDRDRAVEYLVRAADQANTGWERQRAVGLYQQAMDLVEDDPATWRRINLKRAVALQAWAHVVLDVGHLRMAGREG